jgi:Flp pilus assembly protein TadD
MDRSETKRMTGPKIGLIMGTALASVALAGCTTSTGPRADVSFNKAQVALEKGETSKAVSHAEAAVLANPRNAEYRAMLGAAYLEAGRFASAATSFDDALELGDTDPRTVLSFALAKTAIGENQPAIEALSDHERSINPADLGLALALAGAPERGVHVLTNAVRAGHNTAKIRQNLAYTYALAGNWRGARVMAAEDVPADQLDARLSDWANTAKSEDYQVRVANLLGVSPVSDGGQPQHLALGNFPSDAAMFAEAAEQAPAPVPAADSEEPVQVAAAEKVEAAPAAPKPVETMSSSQVSRILAATSTKPQAPKPAPSPAPSVAQAPKSSAPKFVSNPVVQKVPAAPRRVASSNSRGAVAAASSQRRMAVASSSSADTHMVQLGSYASNADAKRAWTNFQKKYPQLSSHDVVITRAEVKGKTYYRVAAAGFGKRSALSMCSAVKRTGGGCFAYAKTNPPAGAVDRGVRIAARTR